MIGGLKAGDIILEIDGNEVKSIMEVSKFITMSTGVFIDFKVKRSYDELILKVKPNIVEGDDGLGNKINNFSRSSSLYLSKISWWSACE